MSATHRYLFRHSSRNYHLVMKVPIDLQSHLDVKWIRRSLKTSNLEEATLLLNTHLSKIQSAFTLLRTGVLDANQIMALKASIMPCKRLENKTNTSLSLAELIDKYISEHSVNWSASTIKSFKNKFDTMIKTLPSNGVQTAVKDGVDINSYTRDSYINYRNKLNKLGYSPKSINDRMNLLSSLLKWGVRNGFVERNHAEGLQVKLDKSADEQRKVYDPDDLKRVIDNLPRSNKSPWMFWIPLIAMYSGMRREEICQLRAKDIEQINGVWCFKIVGDSQAGLTVKTSFSSRIVPVHPYLVDQGFLTYLANQESDANLWGFKKYKNLWEYGKKFGNWFSTFNREYVTQDPLKCFHSFRHTVANTLKQRGVQESLIAELLGHKNDSITTGRYGKKYQPTILFQQVCLL